MKKQRALIVLSVLLFVFVAVTILTTADIGWFIGQRSNLQTWFNLGNTVGSALARELGQPILQLVGIILFIA